MLTIYNINRTGLHAEQSIEFRKWAAVQSVLNLLVSIPRTISEFFKNIFAL
jgi:hypothetical protein